MTRRARITDRWWLLTLMAVAGCGSAPRDQVTQRTSALASFSTSGVLMPFGGQTGGQFGQTVTYVGVVGSSLQVVAGNASGRTFVIDGPTIKTNSNPALCLDIQNGDLTAGVVGVVTCNATINQQWYVTGGQIVSANRGTGSGQDYCLEVRGGTNTLGAAIGLATCTGAHAQAFWPAGYTMKIASTFSVISGSPPVAQPECLDVLFDNESPGASLDNSVCNGTNAQWFVLDSNKHIVLANNNALCLAIGAFSGELAPVSLQTCVPSENKQKWSFINKGLSGSRRVASIANVAGGCLDIQNGSSASGTPVDDFTCNSTPAQLWQPSPSSASRNPWTKINAVYPGGTPGPANVGLLTDGTVLVSDSGPAQSTNDPAPHLTAYNNWFVLKPDAFGSYANGTWSTAASSNIGRTLNPAFVMSNGTFMNCGGEYVTDRYELASRPLNQAFARCESYDRTTNAWTELASMPEMIRDGIMAQLDDGRVLGLSYASNKAFTFSSTSGAWSAIANYDRSLVASNEGGCQTLQDGSIFCGLIGFQRYLPGSNSWAGVAANPPLVSSGGNPEIGPLALLHNGEVLVLGANSNNTTGKTADSAIFTPPPGGSGAGAWRLTAAMPANSPPFNHGDAPATVMRDGRVLVTSTGQEAGSGGSAGFLHEYDPVANTWTLVPMPPSGLGIGGLMRLLDLPNGQVLVTGTPDGSTWLYTPSGTPQNAWRPTITSVTGPTSNEFTLSGTQLNGLTTGGDYGDDGKMSTHYPIVYLTDDAGHVYYARSYNFSKMAPTPGASSSCKFTLPPAIPNGTYAVHVAANGVDSGNTVPLTISGSHVSAVNRTGPLSGTVVLSAPAPSGGKVVTLQSSDTSAITVPASVTVPAGSTTATFTATKVAFGNAIISANVSPVNAQFKPATVQLGWTLKSLLGPSVVYGSRAAATTVSWTIAVSDFTPSGATVNLSSVGLTPGTVVASVPTSVTLPTGVLSGTFTVTGGTKARGLAKITASIKNSTQSLTFSDRDVDFYKCADENGTCASSSQRLVAFGANGVYAYRLSTSASTPCNVATFGNPVAGAKACYLATESLLVRNGQSITVATPTDVAFGGNTGYGYFRMTGAITCRSQSLSNVDPVPGFTSDCYAGPDRAFYTYRGDEGATLSGLNGTPVAYGGAGHFVFQIRSGTVTCNNATFGDPAPNATKSCYTLTYTRPIADEGQGLFLEQGTPVVFGSGLNGNYLVGSISGSTPACTTTFFGGDPDPGQTKHCWVQYNPGATFQALDFSNIYVIGNDNNLWLERAPFGTVIPPARTLVDSSVLSFQAFGASDVFVRGKDGKLWFEHAPFGTAPPARELVDSDVVSFQALDAQHVFVTTRDQKLWLDQAPFATTPRTAVDGSVKAFSPVTTQAIYALGSNGNLWFEQQPFGIVPPSNRLLVDVSVRAVQRLNTQSLFILGNDRALWLAQAPFGTPPPARQQVDAGVQSFAMIDATHVAVLGGDGKLWLEQAPFGTVPNPGRVQIDAGVVTYRPIDQTHILVLGGDGKLWLEQGPFGTVPPSRQQVDGAVPAFGQLGQ